MTTRRISITEDELTALVEKAVLRAFDRVGLKVDDADHQFEANADFRWVRANRQDPDFERNMAFIEKLRKGSENVASRIGIAVIVGAVGFIGYLLMHGIDFWKSH